MDKIQKTIKSLRLKLAFAETDVAYYRYLLAQLKTIKPKKKRTK